MIGGTARVNGELFGERAACAVLSYDYTVLAGTQGALGHRKKDRLFELIERLRLPTVFYAEGGGGRPGDTDYPVVSALDTRAFALWARLSGLVPRIAVVAGRCFAGNAVIAGCSDLIVATESSSLGMGGPAMIEGGGLGRVDPDEVGPIAMQAGNGVVDVVAADEAEATAVTKRLLGYFQGATPPGRRSGPDAAARGDPGAGAPRLRRGAGDRDARRRGLGHLPARALRPGAGDGAGPDRGAPARLHRQRLPPRRPGRSPATPPTRRPASCSSATASGCRSSRWSTRPGSWSAPTPRRPGWSATPRGCWSPGAALRVPLVAVILRRGYGLGAQAMVGGSLHEPLLTVAWPSAHLGPMGLEGAVRLALRKELEAIADEAEREQRVRDLTAAAEENARALNAAALFELDDVIDPAETRGADRPDAGGGGPVRARWQRSLRRHLVAVAVHLFVSSRGWETRAIREPARGDEVTELTDDAGRAVRAAARPTTRT